MLVSGIHGPHLLHPVVQLCISPVQGPVFAAAYQGMHTAVPMGQRACEVLRETRSHHEKDTKNNSYYLLHSWIRKLLAPELDFKWL